MQSVWHHGRPAETHQQTCSPIAVDDLTVLWPGRMGIVQAPEDCRLTPWDGHIWNIDVGWRWCGIPAVHSGLRRLGRAKSEHEGTAAKAGSIVHVLPACQGTPETCKGHQSFIPPRTVRKDSELNLAIPAGLHEQVCLCNVWRQAPKPDAAGDCCDAKTRPGQRRTLIGARVDRATAPWHEGGCMD